jgi:hypothetical protein
MTTKRGTRIRGTETRRSEKARAKRAPLIAVALRCLLCAGKLDAYSQRIPILPGVGACRDCDEKLANAYLRRMGLSGAGVVREERGRGASSAPPSSQSLAGDSHVPGLFLAATIVHTRGERFKLEGRSGADELLALAKTFKDLALTMVPAAAERAGLTDPRDTSIDRERAARGMPPAACVSCTPASKADCDGCPTSKPLAGGLHHA